MKKLFILFFFTLSLDVFTQNKQDYIWLFGLDDYDTEIPGLQGVIYNFNNKPFEPKITELGLGIYNNNVSICNKHGELLFYSNGCAVLNAKNNIMPNGDSINPGFFFDKLWEGDCKNGYPGIEDIIILQDPSNENGFYLIHKPKIKIEGKPSYTQTMLYTFVDMTLDNGIGDVVKKNVVFYNEKEILSSYLTGINHTNGKDWWIIQPERYTNKFLTFLLDNSGIHRMEDQDIGYDLVADQASSAGTARFSPDGTKYAIYNYYHQLHIYDFDRTTGKFSNHLKVEIYNSNSINPQDIRFSSVEWSPNSRFIYTASKYDLHQIDTWEENMEDGVRLIGVYDGTRNPFSNTFFLMAQGPDCRIYMCSTNGNKTYHVINKPDELGEACDFVQNGIVMPYYNGGSMPNFPRFRVDEVEKCDPTIVSVFGDYVWYRRDIKVWPNPSSGVFNIELPDAGAGKLVVTNINGQVLYERDVSNIIKDERIDISKYPSGRYNVEFYPKSKEKERVFYGVQVVKMGN